MILYVHVARENCRDTVQYRKPSDERQALEGHRAGHSKTKPQIRRTSLCVAKVYPQ